MGPMPLAPLALLAVTMLPQDPGGPASDGPFLAGTVEHGGRSYPYRLLAPAELEPGRRYPLILFLHGAGERGEDNRLQLRHFPERMAAPELRERLPVFVLAPQCPQGTDWADGGRGLARGGPMSPAPRPALEAALLALEEVVRAHPVDLDAIHLTGLSMGGAGTWDLAARRPDLFASAVAICGGGDPAQAPRLADLPLQAWHGADDRLVPPRASREMVEAVRIAGGEVRWTELEGVGHDSWVAAYAAEAAPAWMLARRRDPERTLARTLDRLAALHEESGPLALVEVGGGEDPTAALLRAGLVARGPGRVVRVADASQALEAGARVALVVPAAGASGEEAALARRLAQELRALAEAGISARIVAPASGGGRAARLARSAAAQGGGRAVDLAAAVEAHLRVFGPRPSDRPGEGAARAGAEASRVALLELARAAVALGRRP